MGRYDKWNTQGSMLGPPFFVIFINDIPDVIASTEKIISDSTKLYRKINDISDEILSQEDLNKLHQWSVKWQLKFNAKKCKVMHLGSKNSKLNIMDRTTLDTVIKEKDLDVLIDEVLKFHKHDSAVASNANQTLGIIKRTFDTLDKELLAIVYKHQFRYHREYGNAIWHPRYIADLKKVEGVQCRPTQVIPDRQTLSRKTSELKLDSIEYRRKRGDMIQAYKILHKIDRIDSSNFFTQTKCKGTRNHKMKLFKPRFELEWRKHAFSQRIIEDWNSLTDSIVNSESLDMV